MGLCYRLLNPPPFSGIKILSGQFTLLLSKYAVLFGVRIFIFFSVHSVKRKGGTLSEIALVDAGTESLEIEEIVERRPLNTGIKLLANEEFEKETGGYESESEEDEPYQLEDPLPVEDATETGTSRRSKKRKLSNKPQSSK